MDALLDDDDDWHTHWVTLPLNSCLLAAICRASSQLIPWLLSLYVYYRSNFSLILQVSSSPCPSCRVELVSTVCHHPSLNDDQAISVFFQQGNESKPTNTTTSSFYFSRNHSRSTESLLRVTWPRPRPLKGRFMVHTQGGCQCEVVCRLDSFLLPNQEWESSELSEHRSYSLIRYTAF